MNARSSSQGDKISANKANFPLTLDSTWLKLSVEEFFSHCNWQGQPIALQDWQSDSQPLPLTVSVAEFFGSISWEGNPTVGSLPKPSSANSPLSLVEEPSQTTLAELMDLF